jgi:hypothetical protein
MRISHLVSERGAMRHLFSLQQNSIIPERLRVDSLPDECVTAQESPGTFWSRSTMISRYHASSDECNWRSPQWRNHTFLVQCVWNVMAHAQKPECVFRRKGRVHLNRRGASVQSTTGRRCLRISGSNAGYTMFRGSVKSTGYPIHSPVSPSLPRQCVTVCHHISTGL